MTTNTPLSPVLHDIHVSVVSAEEASLGVAEFWSAIAEANRLLALH